jgi:methyltransferase-like protein
MLFNLVPEKPLAEIDLNNSAESLKFFLNGKQDANITTSSPYMKAILYSFSENLNNPISFEQVTAEANKKLHGTKLNEIKAEFINQAIKLVLQGLITITMQNHRSMPNLKKPKAIQIAMYQANHSPAMWVTNLKHNPISINFFEKFAIKYMDGKHDKKAIIDGVMNHVTSGEMNLSRDGKKIEDNQEIMQILEALFDPMIQKFAHNALLI